MTTWIRLFFGGVGGFIRGGVFSGEGLSSSEENDLLGLGGNCIGGLGDLVGLLSGLAAGGKK